MSNKFSTLSIESDTYNREILYRSETVWDYVPDAVLKALDELKEYKSETLELVITLRTIDDKDDLNLISAALKMGREGTQYEDIE